MEWRDVPGYEGLYEVSDSGEVRSMQRLGTRGGIMKPQESDNGYLRVGLRKNGGQPKVFLVHRLVAMAFIPKSPGRGYVNHKDGNKTNNSVDNLEWCTCSENHKHAFRTGLRTPKVKVMQEAAYIKTSKPVHQLSLDGEYIKTFKSLAEAAQSVGATKANISAAALGKYGRKSTGGYKWKY